MKSIKALALVGAVALFSTAGFTSCKPKNEPSNGQHYEGETVKTEFSIAIPEQTSGSGDVRYMPSSTVQRSGLAEFQGITAIRLVPFAKQGEILSSDTRLGKNIGLVGNVESADASKPSHAKVYENVSIPLSTGSFLFYGVSAKTGTKPEIGSLIPDTLTTHNTPASFKFDLEQIKSDVALTATTEGTALLGLLNAVAAAKDGATPTPKSWYEHHENAALEAMFTTYSSMHGLSSFEVARVLTDLYQSLMPLQSSNTLAANIMAAIVAPTWSSADGSGVVTFSENNDFPQKYNIPEGAVQIKWNGSNAFVESDYTVGNITDPANYVYPAQLWYYVNSTVQTANTSMKNMYDNTNDWDAILAAHDKAVSVNSLTRAVAIKDVIQYGVARLDARVKLQSSTLADNSQAAEGKQTPVVMNPSGFPVTGIIIGGQKQVKFDFTPNTTAAERTIYDKEMTQTMNAIAANWTAYNSTLVLETAENVPVKVAIEMENNSGVDFYGVNNQLIPAGGKFYVVGELDPTVGGSNATETNHQVFKQDFTTYASFNLKTLQNAYNTIPDLRTPKLELGFSVDLTWQSGHDFGTIDIE